MTFLRKQIMSLSLSTAQPYMLYSLGLGALRVLSFAEQPRRRPVLGLNFASLLVQLLVRLSTSKLKGCASARVQP